MLLKAVEDGRESCVPFPIVRSRNVRIEIISEGFQLTTSPKPLVLEGHSGQQEIVQR